MTEEQWTCFGTDVLSRNSVATFGQKITSLDNVVVYMTLYMSTLRETLRETLPFSAQR